LIVLLIELETKQFSLAFSKTRGMRQIVGGRDQDSRGGFPRQLAFPPRREQLFNRYEKPEKTRASNRVIHTFFRKLTFCSKHA
jgi:hypothetical protein